MEFIYEFHNHLLYYFLNCLSFFFLRQLIYNIEQVQVVQQVHLVHVYTAILSQYSHNGGVSQHFYYVTKLSFIFYGEKVKIQSLSNFEVYNTVLLTINTTLSRHLRDLFTSWKFVSLNNIPLIPQPQSLGTTTANLCSNEFGFFRFHI